MEVFKFLLNFDLSSFENKEINYRYPSCISKFEIKDFYKDIYDYKILNCGRREIIGNIEYVYQKKKYLFDIKCEVDNSFVLEIPIEKFDTFAGFLEPAKEDGNSNRIHYGSMSVSENYVHYLQKILEICENCIKTNEKARQRNASAKSAIRTSMKKVRLSFNLLE